MQPLVAHFFGDVKQTLLCNHPALRYALLIKNSGGNYMNIEIANRMVQLRKQHGYSQEQLAEKLGLSRQAVSKWERAEASPDTDNLIILSRIYGISLDELLKTDEPIPEPEVERGVKVTVNGKRVNFKNGYISIGEDENDEPNGNHGSEKYVKAHLSFGSGVPIFTATIAYACMGLFYNLWHPGWIVFVALPIFTSMLDWFNGSRRHCFLHDFPFPVLAAVVYLCLGCIWGLWHPGWIIFLFVPLYYSIVNPIDRAYRRKHGIISSIDDDDDDDDDDDSDDDD